MRPSLTIAEQAVVAGVLRRVVVVAAAVAVLGVTTDWIAANLVAPLFSYTGFTHVDAPWQLRLAVTGMTGVVAFALPAVLARPSHVVLWTIFVVCVAPTMLMSPSTGYLPGATALAVTGAVGVSFAVVCLATPRTADAPAGAGAGAGADPSPPGSRGADQIRVGSRGVDRGVLTWTVCSMYSAATYGVMVATTGIHVRFLALDDIYDVRAEYTADVGSGGTLGYLLTGQAYVINPLVLARGLARRRPTLVVAAAVGQFLLYSSTGFKAVLFSFVAVLGMAVLFRGRDARASTSFLVAPIVIMVVSAVADEVQGGITWTSVFTRRFMLTPGLLSSVYVQYFSDNPTAGYGYSFLRAWVDYPYDLPPPKRIADFLVPGSNGYANANLFADGFANLGWAGIPVAALALLVWLRFLDRAGRGVPLRVSAMAVVMPSIMLSNTSIFTAMLSHGLLVGTLVLAIAPRSGWSGRGPTERAAPAAGPFGAVLSAVAGRATAVAPAATRRPSAVAPAVTRRASAVAPAATRWASAVAPAAAGPASAVAPATAGSGPAAPRHASR